MSTLSPALAARYDGRVPRYTSYPTAVQFGPEVTAQVYAGWLAQVPAGEPLSLYVHVPFCARLCWYCGCNTRAIRRRETVRDYVRLLEDEVALLERALPKRPRVTGLHFGGGTPNTIPIDDLAALFETLRHVFDIAPDAQIAAELDVGVLTREWVRAAAFHGLSRASLGVQDLSAHVQQAVNRIEDFSTIAMAVGWLREAGVASVNLDLMYGLPRQTTADVLATLDQVLTLAPERIALFGYAHVPWMKPHQKLIHAADLPGAAERMDQAEQAAARLAREGYVRIGLDHFAREDDAMAAALREGRLHRNFQGYTPDAARTLIGLGASSIGRLAQGYVQNHADEVAWRAAVSEGRLPVARGVALTGEDRFRGEIIERLMCDLTVDLGAVCAAHGRAAESLRPEMDRLCEMEADGLVVIRSGVVRVTDAGRLLVRNVAAVFDAYLDEGGQRHARAV